MGTVPISACQTGRVTVRRRPRLRSKGLVVDSTTTLDLAASQPPVQLKTAGKALWEQLTADPPFWWTEADVPMVGVLCAATDAVAQAMRSADASPAARAAILKEWRSLADQLGMSPTSRSRIKLTEGQAVVAAKRAEAMAGHVEPEPEAMDIDELVGDGQ